VTVGIGFRQQMRMWTAVSWVSEFFEPGRLGWEERALKSVVPSTMLHVPRVRVTLALALTQPHKFPIFSIWERGPSHVSVLGSLGWSWQWQVGMRRAMFLMCEGETKSSGPGTIPQQPVNSRRCQYRRLPYRAPVHSVHQENVQKLLDFFTFSNRKATKSKSLYHHVQLE